jgi:alginate O-acetyltransferase complex protein AlgI
MDFASPLFLFLFLPVFMLIYWLAGKPGKLIAGIIGGLLFYAWGNLKYIPLMAFIIIANYLLGIWIDFFKNRGQAKAFFWTGVLVNIGILVYFRLASDTDFPLGLSYVSFQVIAYLVEIYKKRLQVEKDFIKFSFYILLFPKILVGPITRYGTLVKQIDEIEVDVENVADGVRRFIRGLAKKALIADTLSKVVIPIFNLDSPAINPWIAWLVLISYTLQIFFDFSGYTDMAIGLGKMMGLKFVENFNFPYLAKNIGDFWRRWHISLSSWFRDIVFYPLERKRLKWLSQPINILIVFILTGLWHGFTLNFVAWGLVHGFALVFESTFLGRKLRTLWSPIQHVYTLGIVIFSWILFRSPTLQFAHAFFKRLVGYGWDSPPLPFQLTSPLPIIEPSVILALGAGIIFSLPVGIWFQSKIGQKLDGKSLPKLSLQIACDISLFALLVISVAAIASGSFAPSIYAAF